MNERSTRLGALGALAWANAVAHGLGLVFALFGMRPGSPLVPLAERTSYLAGRPPGWIWGWGVWMICALLLVSWMVLLRHQLPGRSALATLALVVSAAGMTADLLCDAIQIQVLPLAATFGEPGHFLAWERLAAIGGATVANGLYTAGVLLMTLALGARIGAPARWAGFATTAAGSAMAVAGLLPSPALLEAAAGPTIGGFCLWAVLVARDLRRHRAPRSAAP